VPRSRQAAPHLTPGLPHSSTSSMGSTAKAIELHQIAMRSPSDPSWGLNSRLPSLRGCFAGTPCRPSGPDLDRPSQAAAPAQATASHLSPTQVSSQPPTTGSIANRVPNVRTRLAEASVLE
jgi:hypothetical protein